MLSSLSGVAKTTGPESGNTGFDNFKGGPGGPSSAQQESEASNSHSRGQGNPQSWTNVILVHTEAVKKYKKCFWSWSGNLVIVIQ